MVALSVGVCLLATLLLGLIPAMQTRDLDLSGVLKAESTGVVGGHKRAWVRSGLVVVQVSLSFVLLVSAGLLLQSLQKIRNSSPGFSTRDVVETTVNLVQAGYDAPRAQNFQDQFLDRVKALPGVESAAFARMAPLGYRSFSSSPIAVDGYQPPSDEQPIVQFNEVGPDYFTTMGIPLLSGREFTRADDEKSFPAAIVNETMIAKYWRGKNPIGERLQVKGRRLQVVGVAKDSKYQSVRETPQPFFYVPLRQNFAIAPALFIRTRLSREAMTAALTREVHTIDRNLALFEVITLQEQVDRATSPQLVAVTLVRRRGRIGAPARCHRIVWRNVVCDLTEHARIRVTYGLGATPFHPLRFVMSRGLALISCGIVAGTTVALALTRLLGYLLYNVSPRDPLSFGFAFLVILLASLTACFLPAWRPTRTDPLQALRN